MLLQQGRTVSRSLLLLLRDVAVVTSRIGNRRSYQGGRKTGLAITHKPARVSLLKHFCRINGLETPNKYSCHYNYFWCACEE
jgi:hypothetical protein